MAQPKTRISQRVFSVAVCATLGLAATPLLADVKAGVDAWSAGNYEAAVNEWRSPAQRGDADALFNLAQAYRLGRGVPADIGRARELYAEAAQKGHIKAADNYGLLLFQQGEQQAAMPLVTAAAERGDPRAQYVLGLAHFNGDYAPRDWVRAYALLTLSQSAGLPQAKSALAQMDQHVPLEARQQAQTVARQLEAEASRLRAAQVAAADLRRASASTSSTPASQPTRAPAPAPQVAQAPRQVAPVASTSTQPRVPAPVASSNDGPWRVQLGAFGVAGNADRLWSKVSGTSALAGKRKFLVPAGRVTKLQAGGFASRSQAQAACNALKRDGQACLVTR